MVRLDLSRRWWGTAVLALAFVSRAAAQPATEPSSTTTAKPAVETLLPRVRFDQVEGMPRGGVRAFAQDGRGLLWIGTDEGLGRFDGYRFQNWAAGAGNEHGLSSYAITALVADDKSLWVGTQGGGVDRLDLETQAIENLKADKKNPSSLPSNLILSLAGGADGRLWIGTDAGLALLDRKTGAIQNFVAEGNEKSLSDNRIQTVFEDTKTGTLWVGTVEGGLHRKDKGSNDFVRYRAAEDPSSLSNDSILSILRDSTGSVWVGTAEGLNRLDPATSKFERLLADQTILSIAEGRDKGLWLGTRTGVYRLDPKSRELEYYASDPDDPTTIPNPVVPAVFADPSGTLWVASDAGGAAKLYLLRRAFNFYRTNPVVSVLEDKDAVWLGGLSEGLRKLDLKTHQVTRYLETELGQAWTTALVPGGKGSLWIGTAENGLMQFVPATGAGNRYSTETGFPSDTIFGPQGILYDAPVVWVGTANGLVRLDETTGAFRQFKNEPKDLTSLSDDRVVTVMRDRADRNLLWVGTYGGLNRLNISSGKVERFVHDPANPNSLSADHVTYLHDDGKGALWVATYGGGLNRMDLKTRAFKRYRTTEGLPTENIYGILADRAGALWLTTDNGLVKFSPDTGRSITFRINDGLQKNEFSQGGVHVGASGRFYVGGPLGFNAFMPESIEADTYVPPVVFTAFSIDNKPRRIPTAPVTLSYFDRSLSVEFAAVGFAAPQLHRYRYRLSGFEDWIETDRRFVNYTNLPPGNYTLEIQGANHHGTWNTDGLKLAIRMKPAPWRTWWAYAGYVMILVLIVGIYVARQKRRIIAIQKAHRLTELEREMDLVSAVQHGFLPVTPTGVERNLQVEGYYRPAAQCSGDWWWHERRNDRYLVLVGDVTGHGSGPAMVTAAVAACFRSVGSKLDGIEAVLAEMNQEVLRAGRGQMHMTMTAVEIDFMSGEYIIYSAGGLPVFTLPPTGRARQHAVPGTPLGTEEFELGVYEGVLIAGERMLVLTDGLVEIETASGKILGTRQISRLFMETEAQPLRPALEQIVQRVDSQMLGPQQDDWTAVVLQWGTSAVREATINSVTESTLTGMNTQVPRS
jgi:ligand-binding sensor domain-containing protein